MSNKIEPKPSNLNLKYEKKIFSKDWKESYEIEDYPGQWSLKSFCLRLWILPLYVLILFVYKSPEIFTFPTPHYKRTLTSSICVYSILNLTPEQDQFPSRVGL